MPSARSEPKVSRYEEKKDHRDDAVHREESGIQAAQVIGRDKRVLIEEQERDCGDPDMSGKTEMEEEVEPDEHGDHGEVKTASDPEGGDDAECLGNAEEARLAVMLEVLTGVEDVESANPTGDDAGEKDDARVKRTADGDPGGGRRNAEREPQNQMGPARDALHIAVAKQDGQRYRREQQRKPVELSGGDKEGQNHGQRKTEDETTCELAGGDVTCAGTGVGGVKLGVCPAVECHGGRARGNHADEDPGERAPGREAVSGEQRGGQGKGKGEDGVLPLDHLKGDAGFGEEMAHSS